MTWSWLQPAWLLTAGAMVLPILIHLWGRGRGREVVIASLRWFPDGTSRFVRRFRPSDPWLLLVRCLLLLALALAMAEPRLGLRPTPRGGAWIVIEPRVLEVEEGRSRLEELQTATPEADLRWLLPGAPQARLEDPPVADRWLDDQWALVRAVDQLAPPGIRLVLLTTDRLAALPGTRPVVDHELEWAAIAMAGSDEVAVDWGTPTNKVRTSADTTRIDRSSNRTVEGRVALGVAVVAGPGRGVDAALATQAVEQLVREGWSVRRVGDPTEAGALLELGIESTASNQDVAWLLRDGSGPERSCRGWVRPQMVLPSPFVISRCFEPAPGTRLWRTPDDRALLTKVRLESRSGPPRFSYQFASRLHPAWSDLSTAELASWLGHQWLRDGLLSAESAPRGFDRRRAFVGEQQPRRAVSEHLERFSQRRVDWPESVAWILVAFLGVGERWLQWRRT